MFGAAAVRKKRKAKQEDENKEKTRGPYIKPFGPRFDPNSLPYFKYKVNIYHFIFKSKKTSHIRNISA